MAKRLLLPLAFALTTVVSAAHAADAPAAKATSPAAQSKGATTAGIEEMVPLAVGDFKAVVSKGELVYVSGNGRYVFKGKIFDAFARKKLETIDDVRYSTTHLDLKGMGIKTEDLGRLSIGTGKERVTVFVDPRCPYCKQMLQAVEQSPDLRKRYTFDLIAIPMLGKESEKIVRKLGCAKDRKAAAQALIHQQYDKPLEPVAKCDLKPLQKAMVAAQILGVTGVPYAFGADGKIQRGMPKDMQTWLAKK